MSYDSNQFIPADWLDPAFPYVSERGGADVTVTLTGVTRDPMEVREAAPSLAAYQEQQEVLWVPLKAFGAVKPKVGDRYTPAGQSARAVVGVEENAWLMFWKVTGKWSGLHPDLASVCDLLRPLNSPDAAGKRQPTFATLAADVLCRLQPQSGGEEDVLGGPVMPERYVAYLATQVRPQRGDVVESAGVRYTVRDYQNPQALTDLLALSLDRLP